MSTPKQDQTPKKSHSIEQSPKYLKSQVFTPGTLVWAKMKGYPHWPGIVLAPNEISEELQVQPHNASNIPVLFYEDLTYAWFKTDEVWLFHENKEKFTKNNKNRKITNAAIIAEDKELREAQKHTALYEYKNTPKSNATPKSSSTPLEAGKSSTKKRAKTDNVAIIPKKPKVESIENMSSEDLDLLMRKWKALRHKLQKIFCNAKNQDHAEYTSSDNVDKFLKHAEMMPVNYNILQRTKIPKLVRRVGKMTFEQDPEKAQERCQKLFNRWKEQFKEEEEADAKKADLGETEINSDSDLQTAQSNSEMAREHSMVLPTFDSEELMAMAAELEGLLSKKTDTKNSNRLEEILKCFKKVTITRKILEETKIGPILHRIMAADNIVQKEKLMAKELLQKWKKYFLQTSSSTTAGEESDLIQISKKLLGMATDDEGIDSQSNPTRSESTERKTLESDTHTEDPTIESNASGSTEVVNENHTDVSSDHQPVSGKKKADNSTETNHSNDSKDQENVDDNHVHPVPTKNTDQASVIS